MRGLLASGKFWTWFWVAWATVWAVQIPIAMLTSLKTSIEYLIFISLMALVLACLGAGQSSLSMRKADPKDPL